MMKQFLLLILFGSILYKVPVYALPETYTKERETRLQNFFLSRGLNDFDQNLITEDHRKNLEDIVTLLERRDANNLRAQRKNLQKAAKLLESFEEMGDIRLDQRILRILSNLVRERQEDLYDSILDKCFTIKPIKNGNLIVIGGRSKEVDIVTDLLKVNHRASRATDCSGEGFDLYISQEEYQHILDNFDSYKETKDILSFLRYGDFPNNLFRLKEKDFYRGFSGVISQNQRSHLKGYPSTVHPNDLIVPQKKRSSLSFPIELSEFDKQCLSKKVENALLALTSENVSDIKRKAVREKNPLSQYILGILYTRGLGVPKNFIKATEWLERAAENGNPDAQFKLASHYEICLIKRPFFKKIISRQRPLLNFYWYMKAAEQEHAAAQCTLV